MASPPSNCDTSDNSLDEACTTFSEACTTFPDECKENESHHETEGPKKYVDIHAIWEKDASPNDILQQVSLKMMIRDNELIAHIFVDPLLEITAIQKDFFISEGFTVIKEEPIQRHKLTQSDIDMLLKCEWLDPKSLK